MNEYCFDKHIENKGQLISCCILARRKIRGFFICYDQIELIISVFT